MSPGRKTNGGSQRRRKLAAVGTRDRHVGASREGGGPWLKDVADAGIRPAVAWHCPNNLWISQWINSNS